MNYDLLIIIKGFKKQKKKLWKINNFNYSQINYHILIILNCPLLFKHILII
jgi:hypothetical protein